jgi:hypothetical protein
MVWPARWSEVPQPGKLCRDGPKAAGFPGLGGLASQPASFTNDFGGNGLPALATARIGTLALAGMPKLGNDACLLELRDGPKDLPHHFGGWGGVREVGRSVYRNKLDTPVAQQRMPRQLDGQVAGEAAGILHKHNADLVGLTVGQQGYEARSCVDWIAATDRSVTKALSDHEPPLGVGLQQPCQKRFTLVLHVLEASDIIVTRI